MENRTILDEAKMAVYGDRQNDYGSVTDNFNKVAQLWSVVLNVPVTAEQVGLCMVQLKIARQLFKPKRDNLVDGAGYFATLEKMEIEKGVFVEKGDEEDAMGTFTKDYFLRQNIIMDADIKEFTGELNEGLEFKCVDDKTTTTYRIESFKTVGDKEYVIISVKNDYDSEATVPYTIEKNMDSLKKLFVKKYCYVVEK